MFVSHYNTFACIATTGHARVARHTHTPPYTAHGADTAGRAPRTPRGGPPRARWPPRPARPASAPPPLALPPPWSVDPTARLPGVN